MAAQDFISFFGFGKRSGEGPEVTDVRRGFLQTDINKFLRIGQNLAGASGLSQNLTVKPVESTFMSDGGITARDIESNQVRAFEDSGAGDLVSQQTVNQLLNVFTTRARSIRQTRLQPGRQGTITSR